MATEKGHCSYEMAKESFEKYGNMLLKWDVWEINLKQMKRW